MKRKISLLIALLASFSILVVAQKIPPRPSPPTLVNDFAQVLSGEQKARLEQQLVAYDDSTSNQVAIVLIKTLDDYPIEEYALRLFREWGIGNKTTNNGVLILAAIDDHKVRIEVGYGLEGAIPDITASHIIREDIAPNFRAGKYYEGLAAAANSIIKAAAGEYKAPEGYSNRRKKGVAKGIGGTIVIIVLVIIIANRNRGGGGGGFMSRRGYHDGWLGPFILGNMLGRAGRGGGWGGGGWSGGGGFGGGGFGGFGGGSSGGGGASGSW